MENRKQKMENGKWKTENGNQNSVPEACTHRVTVILSADFMILRLTTVHENGSFGSPLCMKMALWR
ncbi:hypothetical protein SBA2_100062 [Acidobacteriia bacterium SbA2]|nr:hypothetical protein SBA2_100062 [Acidobacteriia bacterium SbA2]